ncbi:MAG TPA: response regulator transcription factor [Terriglobia bacterium]|jgi:DNA-binding NarL/FixJ family response regulator|nr:response regulator transcription factor [Terriglobia bacterium]
MRRSGVPKRKSRILLADRERVFCFGLKKLFGVEDDLRVVAEAEDLRQVLSLSAAFKPDILFVQLEILGQDLADSFTQLRKVVPKGRVVVTASRLHDGEMSGLMKAGAAGVLAKSVDPSLFVKCARRVLEKGVWPSNAESSAGETPLRPHPRTVRPADTLTRREKTIVSCLMQGWRNKEIADQLSITEQTVKNHLRTIFDKVGVSDRLELVLYAIHQRLDLPPIEPRSTTTVAPQQVTHTKVIDSTSQAVS